MPIINRIPINSENGDDLYEALVKRQKEMFSLVIWMFRSNIIIPLYLISN